MSQFSLQQPQKTGWLILCCVVLCSLNAWSAPTELPPAHDPVQEGHAVELKSPQTPLAHELTLGRPELSQDLQPPPKTQNFFPFEEVLGFHVGPVIFVKRDQDTQGEPLGLLYGATYTFRTQQKKIFELGIDLVGGGSANVHFNRQWSPWRTEEFRPYVDLGVVNVIEPRFGLANFFNWNNIGLRLAGGMEQTTQANRSLRISSEVTVTPHAFLIAFKGGMSVAW